MNHRGLQRALFRMRLDPVFARAIQSGDAVASASTDLGGAELELLRKADPAGVSADPRGDARAQALRNLSSEFALTRTSLTEASALAFFSSPHFHDAVRQQRSLPLAYGDYVRELSATPVASAIAKLEAEMARARRETRAAVATRRGEVALAPWARLVVLPNGTFGRAAEIRAALDAGRALPRMRAGLEPGSETVLLVASEPAPTFGLRDVEAERLTPLVARFLAEAQDRALSRRDRRAYADREDADEEDLEVLCAALLAEGALIGSLG